MNMYHSFGIYPWALLFNEQTYLVKLSFGYFNEGDFKTVSRSPIDRRPMSPSGIAAALNSQFFDCLRIFLRSNFEAVQKPIKNLIDDYYAVDYYNIN